MEIRAHRAIVLRRNDKGRRVTLLSPRSSPDPLNRRCAGRDEFRADRIARFRTVNRTIWGNVEFLSYPNGIPHNRIEHELQLIRELEYEAYFLTVYDIVVEQAASLEEDQLYDSPQPANRRPLYQRGPSP